MRPQHLLFLAFCVLATACFRDNDAKRTDRRDTAAFSRLVRSYEPQAYKGKVPPAYYDDRGAFDYWRYPLVYPYAINCIDTNDYGSICSEQDKTSYDEDSHVQVLTDNFDRFTFDGRYLAGRRCKTPFDDAAVDLTEQYFIFSFADGKSQDFKGLDRLKQELTRRGFRGDTALMTIRQYDERL
jgi:hypothetical protein